MTDQRYRSERHPGSAWWIDGDPCPDGHGEHCVTAVMVGDDHRWHLDRSELVPISDESYCSGCGQIGCGWGG